MSLNEISMVDGTYAAIRMLHLMTFCTSTFVLETGSAVRRHAAMTISVHAHPREGALADAARR